jgi:SWI/SNF-related matrix-associated actin-dependent regulator of chromatin subfamily A protein 2/4
MKNLKTYITDLFSRIFTIKNLNKVLIIFIIGFSSRVFIGYVYKINVFIEYLNPISILYYTLMSSLAILVHEIITYFDFNIIPSFIFEKIYKMFNKFNNIFYFFIKFISGYNINKLNLTNLDPDANNIKDDIKSKSLINSKNKSDEVGKLNKNDSSGRRVSSQSAGRHRSRHVSRDSSNRHGSVNGHRQDNINESHSNVTTQNNRESVDRFFIVKTGIESTNTVNSSSTQSTTNNLMQPLAPRPNNVNSYYQLLPSTYNPNEGNSPDTGTYYRQDSSYNQNSSNNNYYNNDNTSYYNNIPLAPRPTNLSTPTNLSSPNSGMFPSFPYSNNSISSQNNIPVAPRPSNLSTPTNLSSPNSAMFPSMPPLFPHCNSSIGSVPSVPSTGSDYEALNRRLNDPRYNTRAINTISRATPSTTYTTNENLTVNTNDDNKVSTCVNSSYPSRPHNVSQVPDTNDNSKSVD